MKLSDLKTTPEAVVASEPGEGEQPSSGEQPTGVVQITHPSGIEVYFQEEPKRLYRIRQWDGYMQDAVASEWIEVPSPSSVTEVLEKGGLSWWGMKVGIEGIAELLRRGTIGRLRSIIEDENGVETVIELLKQEKLTVNHVKSAAADRGTNVHGALELFAETGVLPDPTLYPEHEEGYVRGLVQFLKDCDPEVEHSELIVGSAIHGYAGRFDLVAKLNGTKYAARCYPKRASLIDTLQPGGRWLLDLKTSKGVYPSYHLQTAGYEGAFEEDGYEPVDATGVVRVTRDGKYELVPVRATPEDFLALLEIYRVVKRIEGKS